PGVAFCRGGGERAALEMFERGGRLVLSGEVGSLGAGSQSVRLAGSGRLAAGGLCGTSKAWAQDRDCASGRDSLASASDPCSSPVRASDPLLPPAPRDFAGGGRFTASHSARQ